MSLSNFDQKIILSCQELLKLFYYNFLCVIIRFDDIVRLDEAKRLLREAVMLPLQYPQLFTGILRYTVY